jgi:hypothetical protein
MKGNDLMRRDPAAAALMGAMPGGSDFGSDGFDGDMSGEWGDDGMHADAMAEDYWGDDYGAFGAALTRPHHGRPSPAAMARAHAILHKRNARRTQRALLLDPNMGSELKIERYSFSVNITDPATGLPPVLGTPSSLSGTNTPDTHFKPERAVMNVPTPNLVLVNEIKVGNVAGTVGGIGDGFEYASIAVGTSLSLPRMTPSTKASFLGAFTPFVPPGFVPGTAFPLVLTFKGHSTLAPSA